MRPWHILLSILVPAVLTFGLRALPFLLLNKRELPKRIEYLGNVFPMAIMATLVVYCLKSVPASALQDNLILFAGVAVCRSAFFRTFWYYISFPRNIVKFPVTSTSPLASVISTRVTTVFLPL